MTSMLLAKVDETNYDALALSPTLGWLMLAAAICVVVMFTMHADKWRRWWLTAEDPRGIAVFRIVFAFFVMANINGMWEFFEYLFTDEGIFPRDAARQLFAKSQFAGYGDGLSPDDPEGFYDAAAWWQFLRGPKYSLLFFWDSPTFFWAHLWAFELSAVLFMIGFRTRLFGILTWFLMNSILIRNNLPWEGTELVYRVMLTYLVLARSGHAYSVDNWLRCRKLRKQGLLSDRDGPGGGAGLAPTTEHPKGLEPIYRLIPSWPRKLIMVQFAVVYFVTGTLKNGNVWMHGDALYYAINLDHFYRLPPQFLASVAGTTVFRGMTWAVKVGQMLFPLVVVGIITRWIAKEKFAPLSPAKQWTARLAFAALIGLSTAMIYVAYGVHVTPKGVPAQVFASLWIAVCVGVWLVWLKLGTRPFVFHKLFGRTLARPVVIDRVWVSKWLFGRRVLLVWHLAFHMHIFTLMNVGQFQTGMMACTFAFLQGHEIASLLRDIGHRLAKLFPNTLGKLMPKAVVERAPIIPSAEANLPSHQRDDVALPDWAVLLGLGVATSAILVRIYAEPTWDFRWIWLANGALLLAIAAWNARRSAAQALPSGQAPWAYGPVGRVFVGGLLVWHFFAVATWLMPDKDSLGSFRGEAQKAVAHYLNVTTTAQGWGMFAPNPPRSNVFMKVLVVDQQGEVWDLRTDVYAEEQKPIPWIWNTRLRKMNRRIIGGETGPEWYRKWYGRYQCRAWAREHGGEPPRQVKLVKVWYGIPTPEQARKDGYYIAEERLAQLGKEEVVHTVTCKVEPMGQLPNYIRERDGLPLLEDGVYKPWHKYKRKKWDEREQLED
jgi:hypothetical protein